MDKEETRKKLDELCSIHLNGDWNKFKDSLEDIRYEIEELSPIVIKKLRKTLMSRLDKKIEEIN